MRGSYPQPLKPSLKTVFYRSGEPPRATQKQDEILVAALG